MKNTMPIMNNGFYEQKQIYYFLIIAKQIKSRNCSKINDNFESEYLAVFKSIS